MARQGKGTDEGPGADGGAGGPEQAVMGLGLANTTGDRGHDHTQSPLYMQRVQKYSAPEMKNRGPKH